MKMISVLTLVVLFSLICAGIPAFAGGPPSWYVEVNSGQYAPWGQEIVSTAIAAVDSDFPEENQKFIPSAETTSWTSLLVGNDSFGYISRASSPPVINGKIWSGPNETRKYYQATFALYGEVWGTRELTVNRSSDNFPIILNEPVSGGYNKTFWLSSAESYSYSLTAVPEPGGMLAMFSGLIGLGGFVLRRRGN